MFDPIAVAKPVFLKRPVHRIAVIAFELHLTGKIDSRALPIILIWPHIAGAASERIDRLALPQGLAATLWGLIYLRYFRLLKRLCAERTANTTLEEGKIRGICSIFVPNKP